MQNEEEKRLKVQELRRAAQTLLAVGDSAAYYQKIQEAAELERQLKEEKNGEER